MTMEQYSTMSIAQGKKAVRTDVDHAHPRIQSLDSRRPPGWESKYSSVVKLGEGAWGERTPISCTT